MTNITFKNGLPLLLQPAPGSDIGLVAADSGCCCPPPPPERCWCGSFCSYFIEVVEPSELAVKSPTFDCAIGEASDSKAISTLLQAIVPVIGQSAFGAMENESSSYAVNAAGVLSAGTNDRIRGISEEVSEVSNGFVQLTAGRGTQLTVRCLYDQETNQPKHYATITLVCSAVYFIESLGIGVLGSWARTYSGTFELPSTCEVSPERECLAVEQEFLRIDSPLEITLSGDGTSSLGSLTMDSDIGSAGVPPDFPYAKDAVDAMLEEASWTFRITARENCLPPENVCCCEGISGISEIDPDEECEGDVLTKPEEPTDIDTMTVVVEWDGLTAELDSGNDFSSGVISEGIDTFTCVQPGPFEIEADLRQITFASVSASSNVCNLWQFSGTVQLTFEGVGPFGGRPQSAITLDIFVSECHDGYVEPIPAPGTDPSWCPNDYAEPVVTLVIAP